MTDEWPTEEQAAEVLAQLQPLPRQTWYALGKDGTVRPGTVEDFEGSVRATSRTHIRRGAGFEPIEVSTVFLGIDHNRGGGRPMLFETMVFGGVYDLDCQRYATLAEAKAGHREMVAKVRRSLRCGREKAEREVVTK